MNILKKHRILKALKNKGLSRCTSAEWFTLREMLEYTYDDKKYRDANNKAIGDLVLAVYGIDDVHIRHLLEAYLTDVFVIDTDIYIVTIYPDAWKVDFVIPYLQKEVGYNINIIEDKWTGKAIWRNQKLLNTAIISKQ